MTSADLILYIGLLVSAWAAGFTGGYILTKYHDALRSVS